jgi:hypothetical protein
MGRYAESEFNTTCIIYVPDTVPRAREIIVNNADVAPDLIHLHSSLVTSEHKQAIK